MVSTHIRYGSPKQDSFEVHGSPQNQKRYRDEKFRPLIRFLCSRRGFKSHARNYKEGEEKEKEWNNLFSSYAREFPELAQVDHAYKGELLGGTRSSCFDLFRHCPPRQEAVLNALADKFLLSSVAQF